MKELQNERASIIMYTRNKDVSLTFESVVQTRGTIYNIGWILVSSADDMNYLDENNDVLEKIYTHANCIRDFTHMIWQDD